MLSQDADLESVSSLAITDHLPADIIRSLWLIQSLNIEFNERKQQLDRHIKILKAIYRIQTVAAGKSRHVQNVSDDDAQARGDMTKKGNKTSGDDIDALLDSLSTFTLLEDQKFLVIQKIKSVDRRIKVIHSESIRESIKLRFLLESAKKFLNSFSYQLIHIIFTRSWNESQITDLLYDKNTEDIRHIDKSSKRLYPNVTSSDFDTLNTLLAENISFQRPNNSDQLTRFSDYNEEFHLLINSLLRFKSNSQNAKDNFGKKQMVLSIMAKNETFEKCFTQPQPKVKLILRNPAFNDTSQKTPFKLKLYKGNSDSSILSDGGDANITTDSDANFATDTDSIHSERPKLKLTFKQTPRNGASTLRNLRPRADISKSSNFADFAMDNSTDSELADNKQLSMPRRGVSRAIDAKVVTHEEPEVYCVCRTGSSGRMICCDNKNCPYGGWFHYKCIGLPNSFSPPTTQKWYCPWCQPNDVPSNVHKAPPTVVSNSRLLQSKTRLENGAEKTKRYSSSGPNPKTAETLPTEKSAKLKVLAELEVPASKQSGNEKPSLRRSARFQNVNETSRNSAQLTKETRRRRSILSHPVEALPRRSSRLQPISKLSSQLSAASNDVLSNSKPTLSRLRNHTLNVPKRNLRSTRSSSVTLENSDVNDVNGSSNKSKADAFSNLNSSKQNSANSKLNASSQRVLQQLYASYNPIDHDLSKRSRSGLKRKSNTLKDKNSLQKGTIAKVATTVEAEIPPHKRKRKSRLLNDLDVFDNFNLIAAGKLQEEEEEGRSRRRNLRRRTSDRGTKPNLVVNSFINDGSVSPLTPFKTSDID